MENLSEIGKKHGTDKVNQAHTFNGCSYLDIYQDYFSRLRHEPITLLEIGVKEGRSLRVWEEYFPQAQIFAIDIDADCKNYESDRCKIYIGSQDDPSIIAQLNRDCEQGFDIVIDDASHLNELMLSSFNLIWTMVRPQGLYILEDLRNSYVYDIHADMIRGGWNVKQPEGVKLVNDRKIIDNWILDLIKNMDHFKGEVAALNFYPMLAIIKKINKK